MSSLSLQLQRFCDEMMRRLKSELGRFYTDGFMSRHLPQVWVLRTEGPAFTIVMDSQGNVTLAGSEGRNPDVTITTTESVLSDALESRSRPKREWHVAFNTRKGEAAYTYMRGRFGLWG